MLGGGAEPGGDQQRADLVAVRPGGVRLVVQSRPADVRRRGVLEQFFLQGVFAEPGDGAQPPGHGSPGAASGFEVAAEQLDVGAAGGEQGQAAAVAPSGDWRRSRA